MVQDEWFDVDDDHVDWLLSVEFEQDQTIDSVLEASYVLAKLLRRGKAANRFEELIEFEITPALCKIRLRYFTNPYREKLGLGRSGYYDTLGVWFVKYLFAKLNEVRRIASHPFRLPDISVFLQGNDTFDNDPDPD